MKQIVDKLNKIAKKIDESVEIPQTDLIIDSLDAITKAYGGTPNDSNLIVDKLEDIYNNIGSAVSGNIEITENGENINVAPYATATVNVSGGGLPTMELTIVNTLDHYVDIVNIEPMALRTYGVESIGLDVAPGTATYNIVYTVTGTLDNPIYKVYVDYDAIVTASGLVNCTFDNDPTPVLLITDPSESSSATITLSGV